MKAATTIHPHERQRLGLLDLATPEDRSLSVEPDGQPTDALAVETSKDFNVPYAEVTESMKRHYIDKSQRHAHFHAGNY